MASLLRLLLSLCLFRSFVALCTSHRLHMTHVEAAAVDVGPDIEVFANKIAGSFVVCRKLEC